MPYRVIVIGCRKWSCFDLAREVLRRLIVRHGPVEVIQGGASGVDESFAEVALEAGQGVRLYQAEFEAGSEAEGADLCLAVHPDFWNSRSTYDCVKQALDAGIKCVLVDSEACEPVPIREQDL